MYQSIFSKKYLTTNQIRLGRIQYMNVAPVYYAMHLFDQRNIQFTGAPPSTLNRMLADGELDISPVSSVAYAQNQDQWELLPNLSISSFGKVLSVKLVSRYPFKKLNDKNIVLSSESDTAAALLKLLLARQNIASHFTKRPVVSPEWLNDSDDAALIIGDNALKYSWEQIFPNTYDLGEMWYFQTRLPFVFGVWAVRKEFAETHPEIVRRMTDRFYQSKKLGLKNIASISRIASQKLGIDIRTCHEYYQCLNYDLTHEHMAGMLCFFDGLIKNYTKKISGKKTSNVI